MTTGGTGPQQDAFTLSDIGDGRFPGLRADTIVERRQGDGWLELGRYPDETTAHEALDALLGEGVPAVDLRMRPASARGWKRTALAVAAGVLITLTVVAIVAIIVPG
jgi:hypothetical protein